MITDGNKFKQKILKRTIKEHRKEIVYQRRIGTFTLICTMALTAYGLHFNHTDIQAYLTQDVPEKNWVVYLFNNYWGYLLGDLSCILITIRSIIRIKNELKAIDALTVNVLEEHEYTNTIIFKEL